MKRFDELRDLVMSLEGDFQKFYDKENQAAGTRVRKGMQELKNLSQEIRVEVQDIKKQRIRNYLSLKHKKKEQLLLFFMLLYFSLNQAFNYFY